MKQSRRAKKAVHAHKLGYRIVGNKVKDPTGNAVKLYHDSNGYPVFMIKDERRLIMTVTVHLLAAYQKFGTSLFDKDDEVVRHLNDNRYNFRLNNIEVGIPKDNGKDAIRNRCTLGWRKWYYAKMRHA